MDNSQPISRDDVRTLHTLVVHPSVGASEKGIDDGFAHRLGLLASGRTPRQVGGIIDLTGIYPGATIAV